MKLEDDFGIWWSMPRYRKKDFEAKRFSKTKITSQHGLNDGWPGPERDVDYWVELANGYAVGFRQQGSELAEFPVYKL